MSGASLQSFDFLDSSKFFTWWDCIPAPIVTLHTQSHIPSTPTSHSSFRTTIRQTWNSFLKLNASSKISYSTQISLAIPSRTSTWPSVSSHLGSRIALSCSSSGRHVIVWCFSSGLSQFSSQSFSFPAATQQLLWAFPIYRGWGSICRQI